MNALNERYYTTFKARHTTSIRRSSDPPCRWLTYRWACLNQLLIAIRSPGRCHDHSWSQNRLIMISFEYIMHSVLFKVRVIGLMNQPSCEMTRDWATMGRGIREGYDQISTRVTWRLTFFMHQAWHDHTLSRLSAYCLWTDASGPDEMRYNRDEAQHGWLGRV